MASFLRLFFAKRLFFAERRPPRAGAEALRWVVMSAAPLLFADAARGQPTATQSASEATERTAPGERHDAAVVARVGGRSVRLGDLRKTIDAAPPTIRDQYRSEPERLVELYEAFLRAELLARAAARTLGDADGPRRATREAAVETMLREQAKARAARTPISDAEVAAYFAAHRHEFNRPEMRRASHIQVADRQQAMALLAELRDADSHRFRKLALERSEDRETRLRGGDLRYFDREGRAQNRLDLSIEAALAEAAFEIAEVGGIAPRPIAVKERFSIVMLTGRRPATEPELDEVSERIRAILQENAQRDAHARFVDTLRAQTPVVVFEANLPAPADPH